MMLKIHNLLTALLGITIALPTLSQLSLACPSLVRDIDAIVQQPQFRRARFGILVQTQEPKPSTLYSHNADQLFIPASNVKLLTTAAALRSLPSDFTVKTTLYDLGNGRFHLVGEGDPTLADKHLQQLAQSLKTQSIQQINTLTLDERYYGLESVNPDWAWEDVQADYGAPITGLILNENAIGLTLTPTTIGQPLQIKWKAIENETNYRTQNFTKTVATDQPEFININQPEPGLVRITGDLRVGAEPESMGIAVQNPIHYIATQLRQAFQSVNIPTQNIVYKITYDQGRAPLLKEAKRIATITSPPLPDWIQEINQYSNNLYAEALLRQLGTTDGNPIDNGFTSDRGLIVLRQQLTKMGLDPTSYQLVDGSGLGRKNWVTPGAIVQVLQAMKNDTTFRSSLPIAGQSGSLMRRFKNTPAQGILSGKTGFLTGAVGLSGYVQPKDSVPIVYSLLLNQSTAPVKDQIKALDQIGLRLATLDKCQ
jgi:serine-type D-Ala-D-Ala carboxypeptidase/endopeptidase (penicillin-binding protein 4)